MCFRRLIICAALRLLIAGCKAAADLTVCFLENKQQRSFNLKCRNFGFQEC